MVRTFLNSRNCSFSSSHAGFHYVASSTQTLWLRATVATIRNNEQFEIGRQVLSMLTRIHCHHGITSNEEVFVIVLLYTPCDNTLRLLSIHHAYVFNDQPRSVMNRTSNVSCASSFIHCVQVFLCGRLVSLVFKVQYRGCCIKFVIP